MGPGATNTEPFGQVQTSLPEALQDVQQQFSRLQSQLWRLQKLASLGTMASMVAHEFNNLLTPILSYSQYALQHDDDVELMRRALEMTVTNAQRAARMVQSMLGLASDSGQQRRQISVRQLVDETLSCMGRDLAKDGITLRREIPEQLEVYGSPGQLQQVMLNLLINARQAMLDGGGTLTISARAAGPELVEIHFADTGCGIKPETLQRIFEPFFSTKTGQAPRDRRGTGLGLSVCKQIVEDHGGRITVVSNPGQGSTFTLILPAVPPRP